MVNQTHHRIVTTRYAVVIRLGAFQLSPYDNRKKTKLMPERSYRIVSVTKIMSG